MNCPKTLELIKESQELHTQALAQIQQFCDTFFDMRPKNDLNIFTELRKINTEYERLKKQISENVKIIEDLFQPFTYEKYLTDLHSFMLETCKKSWAYTYDDLEIVDSVVRNPDNIHIDEDIPFDTLKSINSDEFKREANKSKTGEIYISSEQIDFETAKTYIPEIPDDIKEQGVSGVMKYIHETYKDTHIFPDLRYYQYLAQLGDQYKEETDPIKKEAILKQIPKQLQDGKRYYFPGSIFVRSSGDWMSPCLFWVDDEFRRSAGRVEIFLGLSERVILLEK